MGPLNKQDAQNLIENAKNRIIEKVATRQDVQLLSESSRDKVMNYVRDLLQVYQQNMLRRSEYQQSQMQRRMVAMETRMITMEQELKATRGLLNQILEKVTEQASAQKISLPAQAYDATAEAQGQYAYRPN